MTCKSSLLIPLLLLASFVAAGAIALLYARSAADTANRLEEARLELSEIKTENQHLRHELKECAGKTAPPPRISLDLLDSSSNRIAELKAQISKLEKALEERAEEILALRSDLSNSRRQQENPPRPPWRNREERMEELKVSDPERYAQIMQEREESRKRMQKAFADKASHFLDRDTASMTEEEAAQHAYMLQLLQATWSLAEKMRSGLSREQRRELLPQMRDNVTELIPLLDEERDRQFLQLGRDFGYTEEEAIEFVDYMNEVIDITSMRPVFESMRPGRGFIGPPPAPPDDKTNLERTK